MFELIKRKALYSLKKIPTQQRSKGLVQAVLDATMKIINTSPNDLVNMTEIARVAGISVGSLYQYFPNKKAIVASLVEYHCRDSVARMKEIIQELNPQDLNGVIIPLVDFAVDYHFDRKRIYQFMYSFLHTIECVEYVKAARHIVIDELEKMVLERKILDCENLRERLYFAVVGTMALIDYALVFDDFNLDREVYKLRLKQFVTGYFTEM